MINNRHGEGNQGRRMQNPKLTSDPTFLFATSDKINTLSLSVIGMAVVQVFGCKNLLQEDGWTTKEN